mmetsp:Transcript_5842/g.10514  ORF Transcript_5842/g.10514 Transcript_5842/m.10514 type:complete len:123 (-) Transcript_5842:584-952(-)
MPPPPTVKRQNLQSNTNPREFHLGIYYWGGHTQSRQLVHCCHLGTAIRQSEHLLEAQVMSAEETKNEELEKGTDSDELLGWPACMALLPPILALPILTPSTGTRPKHSLPCSKMTALQDRRP